ncbi:MAG: hypothetical protein ABR923_17485 [Terracidiphilus sp.]|jgi:hypothetical protein
MKELSLFDEGFADIGFTVKQTFTPPGIRAHVEPSNAACIELRLESWKHHDSLLLISVQQELPVD